MLHMADLFMLETVRELDSAFINQQTGMPKSVECIRVNGVSDEVPSHEEIQFWWTQRHILKKRVATLITTQSRGSSFLNRVQLQDGCLRLGHANCFIPSTLAGFCLNEGKIEKEKLDRNLFLPIDA